MLRPLLVFWLIFYSLRYRTRPWNFFQLNSDYFNREKKIFSKQELNDCVPEVWRLSQLVDDGRIVPSFPVFVKPEWGQNSHGVALARDLDDLQKFRRNRKNKTVTFLLQEAAPEQREFEIFYLRNAEDLDSAALLSVTETINLRGDVLPVNGINNRYSAYIDKTDEFSDEDLKRLWTLMKQIGHFRIARVGLRADTLEAMLDGSFHVIEVNIFLPMPLALLDQSWSWDEKHQFIRTCMRGAAMLAAKGPRPTKRLPIFFHKLVAHYRVKE